MKLVDTHCHIQSIGTIGGDDNTHSKWEKSGLRVEEVLKSANKVGVDKFICVGCDLQDSQLALSFSIDNDNCFAAVGIHPHEARMYVNNSASREDFTTLIANADREKLIAVGECGLDYFYHYSPASDQQKILTFQLDLAVQYSLPVIFHVRDAYDDFWPIFDSYKGKIKGVLHSFTDSQINLNKAIDRGLFIGVNGIATFIKQPEQLMMLKSIPIDRLLFETDAPYLTPTPYRGTINEPKHVRTVAEYLAVLRGESLKQLASLTSHNAHLLFGI